MTQYIKKILAYILLTLILYTFLMYPNIIILSVNNSLKVFIESLFPSLFPFLILSDILNNYNYFYYIQKIFKFKYSDIILMCAVSGLPSNAKYISAMLDNNEINKEEAEYLLSCTFFPSPMYVISVIGFSLLHSKLVGFILLIIVYISNVLFFIFNYKKFKKAQNIIIHKRKTFSNLIKQSITNNIEILLIILGTLVVFNSLINIISYYFEINDLILSIINLFLEMTSGINKVTGLSIKNNIKYILICTSLSFSGISVLSQAISILSKYNLNIRLIIKQKIIIALISLLLSSFYFLLTISI